MKMVIEKSLNMKNWPKVMEFCDQSWNFVISHGILLNLPSNFIKFVCFVTAKKFSRGLESLHFPMFSPKCRECKIGKRDGHGKSRNGHGKVVEKYFVKYVGTLIGVHGLQINSLWYVLGKEGHSLSLTRVTASSVCWLLPTVWRHAISACIVHV